jgi:hypothetical protein
MRVTASILCGFMCVCFAAAAAVAEPAAGGVSVMTASDSSPDHLDAHARKLHGQIARRAATETLHRNGIEARHAGAAHQLDVAVTRWRVASAGGHANVTAEIRIVLCDDKGKMLSIVNGKATISGEAAQLASLRAQAISEGVGHLVARLGPQLARTSV